MARRCPVNRSGTHGQDQGGGAHTAGLYYIRGKCQLKIVNL